ncbi:MAG: hypothetical protein ACPGJS_07420 [Flammeovirgaceae bacterium]
MINYLYSIVTYLIDDIQKKMIGMALIVFLVVVIPYLLEHPDLFQNYLSDEEELAQAVLDFNQLCPLTIQEHMRVDQLFTLPDSQLQLNVTIIPYLKSELSLGKFIEDTTPNLIAEMAESPNGDAMLEDYLTLSLLCFDQNGAFIDAFEIEYEQIKKYK